MKKLEDLLHGVVCKKNKGYRFHRGCVGKDDIFFTKSLDITKTDVEVASNILKIININTREDLFLGLTCVCLLSSYEKRQKILANHKGKELRSAVADDKLYHYKSCVNEMIIQALKNDIDFSFCIKKDAKGQEVTYVEVGGVQMSFHNGNTSATAKFAQEHGIRQYKDMEWDKSFAFQNGAKEAFLFALNLKNTSKLSYIYEKPVDYAKSLYREQKGMENSGKQV